MKQEHFIVALEHDADVALKEGGRSLERGCDSEHLTDRHRQLAHLTRPCQDLLRKISVRAAVERRGVDQSGARVGVDDSEPQPTLVGDGVARVTVRSAWR